MARSREKQLIAIRTSDDPDTLVKVLLELPHVHAARHVSREAHVELDGGDEQAAELLAEIIRRGHRVIESRHIRDDLEDIFMKVTKGEVQ